MLIKIHAENFRSYPVLDWTIPEGLTLIDGNNADTGGSNMCGKSNLLDSWAWARYGWLPKWGGPKGGQADSVIRRKDGIAMDGCRVAIQEQIGADFIEIERERPSRLTVRKNGIEIKGIDQKGLDRLLGMSSERFLICVYLSQKRRSSFYWMSDTERMDMLSVIAGLEELNRALLESKETKQQSEISFQQATSAIHIFENQLYGIPDALAKLRDQRLIVMGRLNEAKDTVFKSQLALDSTQVKIDAEKESRLKEITQKYSEQIQQTRQEQQELSQSRTDLKKRLDSLPGIDPELSMRISSIQKEMLEANKANLKTVNIEDTNKHIRWQMGREIELAEQSDHGKCEACNQILPESERVSEMERHLIRAKDLEQTLKIPPELIDIESMQQSLNQAVNVLNINKAELAVLPTQLKSQIAALDAQINLIQSRRQELMRAIEIENTGVMNEYLKVIKDLKTKLLSAETEVGHLEELYGQIDVNYQSTQSQETALKQSLKESTKDLIEAKESLDQSLDLIELFGPKGYRAVCFDGLVERISQRAGELLSIMTEGLYSTRLEQLAQDSKGNQKLVLKPIIRKGSTEVPLDDLSGGAETRVALAYDVAVAECAGDGLPLLLDETLEGLDAVGKSEAMLLLEEVSKSRPVLVIDHASEFKAAFAQVMTVSYQSEVSVLNIA